MAASFYKQANLTRARTDLSEFELNGLTACYQDEFLTPIVKKLLLKIGLGWVRTIDITENSTHLIIGQIEHIFLPSNSIE